MSGPSILNSVDSNVLTPLCCDNVDSVYTTMGIENSMQSLGLLNQLSDVTRTCELMFKNISSRLFSLNKRIRNAGESIEAFERTILVKQEELYANSNKKLDPVEKESVSISSVPEYNFFSIAEGTSNKMYKKSIPNLSKLILDTDMNVDEEFTSSRKKESMEIRRRVEEPKPMSPKLETPSIFSSITRRYNLNKNHRMSSTLQNQSSFDFPEESLNTSTSSIPKATIKPSKPVSKNDTPVKIVTPPPPPSFEPKTSSRQPASGDYKPPKDFLNEVPVNLTASTPLPSSKQQSSKTQPPVPLSASTSSTPPRAPTDFLSEIRKKGTDHQEAVLKKAAQPPPPPPVALTASTSQTQTPLASSSLHLSSIPQSSDGLSASTSNTPPPRALPTDFLSEIRKKGTDHQEAVLKKAAQPPPPPAAALTASTPLPTSKSQPPVALSATTPINTPPPRALPTDFLSEIRKKGTERQEAVLKKAAQPPPPPAALIASTPLPSKSQPPAALSATTPVNTPPPRALPTDFLSEIRKKGTERQEAALKKAAQPPPPPAAALSASAPVSAPSRALPVNFLEEIRKKGMDHQEAVLKKTQETPLSPTLRSRQNTIGGTVRSGTLGGNSRASNRYGTGILNDLRGLEKDTFLTREGDEESVPKAKSMINPMLNEIRSFDIKKLRKVTKVETPQQSNTKSSGEPTVADMLRERLRIMQSDSSDDSDSSSDFSDYFCLLPQIRPKFQFLMQD